MTVCVCIATRGRPNELDKAIRGAMASCSLLDTHFAVALDEDDPFLSDYQRKIHGEHIHCSTAERDKSLGAKYNRAASYALSGTTVYVLGVDDCYIFTKGWDKNLLDAAAKFQDGVGCVYFGEKFKDLYRLPDGIAVTKGWIDQVGFFMPTYFPFWWHDTWVDELARLTGRYVWANAEWDKFGETEKAGSHKTTRMREVSWWARFFDATRQTRVDKAVEMINRLNYPEWHRTQLKQEMQAMANVLWRRNGLVRDRGNEFERTYGSEGAPAPDAGYVRIRDEAEALLATLK
jgi:hypothetical protein